MKFRRGRAVGQGQALNRLLGKKGRVPGVLEAAGYKQVPPHYDDPEPAQEEWLTGVTITGATFPRFHIKKIYGLYYLHYDMKREHRLADGTIKLGGHLIDIECQRLRGVAEFIRTKLMRKCKYPKNHWKGKGHWEPYSASEHDPVLVQDDYCGWFQCFWCGAKLAK